jgi:protein-arginine kinase activator protein McsA
MEGGNIVIYQLEIYYGAMIGGKSMYSSKITFNDCKKPFNCTMHIEAIKEQIENLIRNDGFEPADFVFDYLTKEQYDNRIESRISLEIEIKGSDINVKRDST